MSGPVANALSVARDAMKTTIGQKTVRNATYAELHATEHMIGMVASVPNAAAHAMTDMTGQKIAKSANIAVLREAMLTLGPVASALGVTQRVINGKTASVSCAAHEKRHLLLLGQIFLLLMAAGCV